MKRPLILIGLALLLLPRASAAAESEICKALKDIEPVSSHYVQKVLERADKGLQKAKGAADNPGLEKYFFSWGDRIRAAANSLIDSYLTMTVAERSLPDTTACLRVDVLLLDCKIDETQSALQSQLGRKSILGMVQLESLLAFLQERKTHLVRGALNPNYRDPTWEYAWRFEEKKKEPDASQVGPQEKEPEPLCPFDSDYAPPASDGYGCDTSVLGKIAAYAPARDEREALRKMEDELKKYKGLATEFGALEQELNALYEGNAGSQPVQPAGGDKERDHRELNGCKEANELPEDMRLRSLRTPFSYGKSQLYILSEFLGKRASEGMFREQEDTLKNAEEIEDEEKRKKYVENNNPLLQLFRDSARAFFQGVSGMQGRSESSIFAASPDSTLEMAEALGDLRKSVGELSRLSGPKEGLRTFVINFAYFLRRSCVYRPCNTSLERVLRTAYADECFPYTDGDFLQDSKGDPRWKKCAQAACIQVDGVSLPGNCKDVLP